MIRIDYALRYAELGIHVLPIWWLREDGSCACGRADCVSPGKHPLNTLAPRGHLDATTDEAKLRAWFSAFPDANLGISLEPSFLCAIDVDPRNGGDATLEKLETEHGPITSGWHQRTGSGGEHFVFACSPTMVFPGKFGAGIDGKHRGYILAEPSRTIGDYEWLDGGPLDGDIPSELPAWVVPQAATPRVAACPAIDSDAPGFEWMGEDGQAEFRDALAAIPNWERDDWLKVGMVLHMLDPNPEGLGYKFWEWWSCLGKGADKFDAKDQARVWLSFSRRKNSSLHRESIFFWARENGWKGKADKADKAVDAIVAQIIDRMDNGIPVTVEDAEIIRGYGRCPVPMIEETAALLSSMGGYHHLEASLAAALALAGHAAARRYVGTEGSPANLYIALTADSVNEIRYALLGVESILSDSGLRRTVRATRFGGPGALYKTLFRSPSTLYLTSEWETLLRFARRQPSGTTEQVLNILSDIYLRRDLQIDGADEFGLKAIATDDQPVIRNPSLSMLAAMSMDGWELLGKSSEIGRGATESMFAIYCHPDGAVDSPPVPSRAPVWLVEHVRTLRGMGKLGEHEMDSPLSAIFTDSAEMRPLMIPVHFDVDLVRYDAGLNAITDRRALRPLIHGAKTTMRRIAVALAAWCDPSHPVVSPWIMEWCAGFVAYHAGVAIERIGIMDNEGAADVGQKVLVKLVDAGKFGLTQREIVHAVRGFKSMSPEDKKKLLDRLMQDGDIIEGDPEGKRRGKRFVASKYVVKASTQVAL